MYLVCSNIIHEKCKLLRSNNVIFLLMGPRNLMGGYRGFLSGHYHYHPKGCEDGRRFTFQNIHNHVPDQMICVPD